MRFFSLFFLLLLASCQPTYLAVDKEFVDKGSLASTFVKSPDPAQQHPPEGIRLWVSWNYPPSIWKEGSIVYLKLVYGNYEKALFCYPMDANKGEVSYALLNEEYKEKEGILTYSAEVITPSGEPLSSWQHQMWFELIEP